MVFFIYLYVVNLSINHGSNDGSFPFLSSCNGDVKSLKVYNSLIKIKNIQFYRLNILF